MFIDCYQVEVQSLVTEKWKVNRRFCPQYEWRSVTRRILCGLLRRTRQEIVGDPHIQALIVKTNAHQHARNVVRFKWPQSVRITRLEREGARLVKFVIWQDGKWCE